MSKNPRRNTRLPDDATELNRVERTSPSQHAIQLVWRVSLPERPKSKTKRRPFALEPSACAPTEALVGEQVAWQQVNETGSPVLFDGKWLMPEGMNPWAAIELLPDGVREQTRAAMQRRVGQILIRIIEHTRNRLREQLTEQDDRAHYDALPRAAQMALAESIVRRQLGFPEIPLYDLMKQYGLAFNDASAE